jgi:hypothetical protein
VFGRAARLVQAVQLGDVGIYFVCGHYYFHF